MSEHDVLPECRMAFEQLGHIHRMLLGDGNPRESLCGRLQAVEDAVEEASRAAAKAAKVAASASLASALSDKKHWDRITTVLAILVAIAAIVVGALK